MTIAFAVLAALFAAMWWRERGISADLTRDIVTMRIAQPFQPPPPKPAPVAPRKDTDVSEREQPILAPIVAQLMANGAREADAIREARRLVEEG